jgi:hypothetical protein
LDFRFWIFELVSDFDIRISDLKYIMETNQNNNRLCGSCGLCGMCGEGIKKAAVVALSLLSLFLLAASIGEFKKIPTIGKDLPVINTISVSGTGEVIAVPDIATFSFSVTDESLSIVDSQNNVTKATNDILDYLQKNGVDKKDIKTTGYNIYPRYEYYNQTPYSSGKRTLAGYDVSQSVAVKVRKIADAGKIIGGVGELGATDVSGLTFGFDKDDELKAAARKDAVTKAKAQAAQIAADLGVSLGRIVSYTENGNYPIVYGMNGGEVMSARATPTPNLPSGENKITSTVNITYEIR